jgi:hypothetical protein
MSKKLELRYKKTWYNEPPPPESGAYKFRVELLKCASGRACHFPGASDEGQFYALEYDEPESTPEYCGTLDDGQAISLETINALVKKHRLDEKNVFLTASFSDDYLGVEVVHIRELDEQEQLEEHKEQYTAWVKRHSLNKERELERLQDQIEALQRQAENLKKK